MTDGRARCDLPGYERWYYSTGNLYRKTSGARFGWSAEKYRELFREAVQVEALRPSYLKVMNTSFDRENHSLVLNALGVPHYDLQERQADVNNYYYEFYTDLATRNGRTVATLLEDFTDCFWSSCNDECLRGTNTDLRACTDITPELRAPNGDDPDDLGKTSIAADGEEEAAGTRRLLGLKQMMRSCWTRGGEMCSDACSAVSNETWTCMENQRSCRRFMLYFTRQLREEEETCLFDLRTPPTTAAPELTEFQTEIWKAPAFRRVLLTEGPISAAYLVERMCSTLSTMAECMRESICSWQKIRRASADLYTCAVDDNEVFFNAASLDEVLSVGEEFKRVCYFNGFDEVCTRNCPGSLQGNAQILHIAGLLLFLISP